MKIAPLISVFLLLSVSKLFLGCNRQPADNSVATVNQTNAQNAGEQPNITKDNADLEMIVKMPYEPEEADWREEATPVATKSPASRAPAQTGKKITAVVKFSAENANRIVEQAQTHGAAQPVKIGTESWFPAELIALGELSGDETLKGVAYAANDFYQPPYAEGKLTRIENSDYFVLELHAK